MDFISDSEIVSLYLPLHKDLEIQLQNQLVTNPLLEMLLMGNRLYPGKPLQIMANDVTAIAAFFKLSFIYCTIIPCCLIPVIDNVSNTSGLPFSHIRISSFFIIINHVEMLSDNIFDSGLRQH